MKYSVVIAAKNEATSISACISSAAGVNEIVVIDDQSTDDTASIAKNLGARVYRRTLDGFANQKNFGIDKTSHQWVLILDADERLTPQLAEEIASLEPPRGVVGYQMAFRNHVGHKWLRHGGLYPDYHIRLFDKTKAHYGPRQIHEQLDYTGEIKTLKGDIIHLTYQDFGEYRQKVERYARLEAAADTHRPSWLFIAKTFYRKYAKDAGWMDGYAGFKSAVLLTRYQIIKRQTMS